MASGTPRVPRLTAIIGSTPTPRAQSTKSSVPTWLVSTERQARSSWRGPVGLGADPVLPAVVGDEVAPGVAHDRDPELADEVGDVGAEAQLVGRRVTRLVDAGVDAPAHVLDEGPEDPRPHRPHREGGVQPYRRSSHAVLLDRRRAGHTVCCNGYPFASPLKITTVTETCPEVVRGQSGRRRRALACSSTRQAGSRNGRRHGLAARLRDVAERAGVSVKTASNVLNHHPHVKASTRERVEAAMAELHYRPNLSARSLKHGRAGFLALAVPAMDSPYFAELAARITEEAAALGFIVLLDVTGGDADAERVVLEGMRSHVIDGVIFSPLALSADEIGRRADSLPMVLLGERPVPTGFDHIAVDSVAAARAATEHLVAQGRRRIAAVGSRDRERHRLGAAARLPPGAQGRRTCPTTPTSSSGSPTSSAPTATPRCSGCSTCPSRRTPSSASTTSWPSARCAPASRPACGCRRRSPSSASTTSPRPATPTRPSRRSPPTSPAWPGPPSSCCHAASTASDGAAEEVEVAWTLEARETTLGVPARR